MKERLINEIRRRAEAETDRTQRLKLDRLLNALQDRAWIE